MHRFCHTNVLVIGDVMMDEYIWGNVSRISPEAPVPILDVISESQTLGGAANVIHNVHTLGGKSLLCSVIGDDAIGKRLQQRLYDLGVNLEGLLIESTRPTTIKTRIIAQYHRHYQQMVRLDRETRNDISSEQTARLIETITKALPTIDAIIIEDYGKGVVASELVQEVITLSRRAGKIVAVDPKTNHFARYAGASVITPNHFEAGASLNLTIESHQDLLLAGRQLLEQMKSDYVLITRGKDGMSLFERESRMATHIPTMALEVFDVAGAGDTVIAALTLGLASGVNPVDAVLLSNAAAGVVVGKMGVATVNQEELLAQLLKMTKRELDIQREKFV
ncbi:PfkB domain protein [Candidatus Vecturithrix granuli]|uniref:PfkB domain protein n=1 Tax=Vecturithrix granuli TaxID=1499967 RepID=A0A081BUN0_VECG1|nr:PfkB domain protein [Candidatus Vecturithrix granuli]